MQCLPLLVRPEMIVFGRTYVLPQMFIYFFFEREISEMHRPIGMKFCKMISSRPNFITPVQNFRGPTPENFRGQKHAKFDSISDDFKVWRWISLERIKMFKIRQVRFVPRFLSRWVKEVQWTLVHQSWRLSGENVPNQIDFLEDHILAPKRCCAPKLLHALEND